MISKALLLKLSFLPTQLTTAISDSDGPLIAQQKLISTLSSQQPLMSKSSMQSSSLRPSHTNSAAEYITVSDKVKTLLVQQISTAVEDVLDSMMHEGTRNDRWCGKMHKDGIVYYEDKRRVRKEQMRFCCMSVTNAPVEDVIKLFVVSDLDIVLQPCLFMDDVDTRILSVLKHPSEEHPMRSAYIRYTAFKTPVLLRNHRDMCVVIATDVIHCPNGSAVGYCVWDSLHLPEVSTFDIPQGFIRSRMFRSGYFVQNSGNPGAKTMVAYLVGIEAGGVAPRLAMRYVIPRFGAALNQVIDHFQPKQLDPLTFASLSEWTDKRTAKHCQCCSKYFGIVKMLNIRRYNCVVCGIAICHACHHIEDVEVRGAQKMIVNVCVGCRSASRKRPNFFCWSSRWGPRLFSDTSGSS